MAVGPLIRAASPARRAALALTVLSFVGWSSWELLRPAGNPLMDLSGRYTDHYSHMNAGRVFMRHGADVWRVPLDRLAPHATAAQLAARPADLPLRPSEIFKEPGWDKLVLQSWPQVVRFYPPGDMVLTAPVALLYHFTPLSASGANRLLLVLFLLCAHAGLFVLLEGLLALPDGAGAAAALAGYLAVNVTLHWTLEGIYDAAFILPLLLAWRFLGQRRGLAALVCFSVAAFLHFRSYYYGPWALAAAWLIARDRSWRGFAARDWLALTLAGLMSAASLYSFFLALPGLLHFEQQSRLVITSSHLDPVALALAGVIAALALAAFASARSWADAVQIGWMAVLLTTVRQSYPWYTLAAVPWLCAPPREGQKRLALIFNARVLVFLFLALYVHPAVGDLAPEAVLPGWLVRLCVWGHA